MLAHAGASDESLSVALVLAGLWTGWAAWSRIRGRGFPRVPLPAAWAGVTLAIVLVASAAIVPARVFPVGSPPGDAGARPGSTASLAIVEPAPGATAGQDLEVVLRLDGGRVVDTASTELRPDTGHVHLAIDGAVVSMTYGLAQSVSLRSLQPGEHVLQAEFVAADHGPFSPRVTVSTTFVKDGSA